MLTATKVNDERMICQRHLGISLDKFTDVEETIRRVENLASIEKVDVYIEHSFFVRGTVVVDDDDDTTNTTTTTTSAATRSSSSSSSSDMMIHRLMEAIGSLPNLNSLALRSMAPSSGRFVRIPLSALEIVLTMSPSSLKRLDLSHLDFTTTTKTTTTPRAEKEEEEDLDESRQEDSGEGRRGTNSTTGRCCSYIVYPCPLLAVMQLLGNNKNKNKNNTTNYHLKELNINLGGYRKISKSTQYALLHWLQYKNYYLEHFNLDMRTFKQFSSSKRKRIQFYLDLNKGGMRQKLLLLGGGGGGGGGDHHDTTSNNQYHQHHQHQQQEWEDAIISNRNQSSTVYYLLSNNPTMISCV